MIGERLKAEGMARALTAADVSNWKRRASWAIEELAMTGESFTSEDVTTMVGLPRGEDAGQNANAAVGAMIAAGAARGLIRRIGTVKARRSNQHAAEIGLWVGA